MNSPRVVVGGLAIVLIVSAAAVLSSSDLRAQDPGLAVSIDHVSGSIGELIEMPMNVQTFADPLNGIQISLSLSRPDLVYFEVDTQIVDTDTSFICHVETDGTLCEDWGIAARSPLGTGLSLSITGGSFQWVNPIPEESTGVLLRIPGRIRCDIPIEISDRTAGLVFNVAACHYSDPDGFLLSPVEHTDGSLTANELLRGDINLDGSINPQDVVLLVQYVYLGYSLPSCGESADLSCDGAVNPLDVVYAVNFVYLDIMIPPC